MNLDEAKKLYLVAMHELNMAYSAFRHVENYDALVIESSALIDAAEAIDKLLKGHTIPKLEQAKKELTN